ncbi:MAG: adenylate kinase [Bacteroidetes bacterium]|nr:MAG: adenylate kinase [Bacteroidota bacterium]RLD71611.1 MAG: adenylate kinase [Bacteroidota bacterium]RLD89539.1 MAG: adenylate kinase [Bacteroidota bacterium]
MLNIALFGPPGSGKGTQSKKIIEKYNLAYISTGDMLRAEIAEGSDLGKRVKSVMDAGELVSDELVVQILEKKIKNLVGANGILFDGFPRNLVQAYILTGLLAKLNTELTAMISLEVPEEELMQRMLKRAELEGRSDDKPETIKNRFRQYESKTRPVSGFYREMNKCYPVNGVGTVEEIFQRVCGVIDGLK